MWQAALLRSTIQVRRPGPGEGLRPLYGLRAELDAGVVFAAFAIGAYPPIAVLYEWKSATPR